MGLRKRKLFYDNFSEDEICGLYSLQHIAVIVCFFVLLGVAVFFSKKIKAENVRKVLIAIAIVVTCLEITKIIIRIYKGESGDGWIPLYFCHLFIYAIWFSICKNQHLKNLGMSFMVFGGIVAGIANILYPSTSLMLYPLYHPGCLYSILYHFLMTYCGCLLLSSGVYQPRASHFFGYFTLVTVASAIAVIVNHFLGTNMMFLGNPFALGFLQSIFDFSKGLYMFLAYFAQAVLLFWASFGLYKLIEKIKNKNKKENGYGSV